MDALPGWRPDPSHLHEFRFFAMGGKPTRLVSDNSFQSVSVSNEIPDVAAEIPEIVAEIPDVVVEIPEVAAEIDDVAAGVPDIAAQIPDAAVEIPDVNPAILDEGAVPVTPQPSRTPQPAAPPEAAATPTTRFCAQCGTAHKDSAAFCPKCGQPISVNR
jgi:zinc ribbon protein